MKTVKNDILKGRALSLRVASLSAVLFVICLFPLQAQDSDFVTWNKMKARYDVSPKVELYGDVEMRTRDALEEIDRWGFGVGASVRLLSFLKAEGGYEFHYRNRFQHTFDGRGADEFRLRTRLKAAYKVTTWSPYVSLEQYHGLGKDEWFHASRFRARGGVEAKLSSSWSADVFYCYQHESDLDRHVLGWELIYRF